MSILEEPPRYHTYLLTMWEERSLDADTPVVWRFRLEDPRTGERKGYADLEALVRRLEQEMSGARLGGKQAC